MLPIEDLGQLKITQTKGQKNTLKLFQIPHEIYENEALNQAILALPNNYNFEIHKR